MYRGSLGEPRQKSLLLWWDMVLADVQGLCGQKARPKRYHDSLGPKNMLNICCSTPIPCLTSQWKYRVRLSIHLASTNIDTKYM